MQGQDQLAALADRSLDEQAQASDGVRSGPFCGEGIGEDSHERAVGDTAGKYTLIDMHVPPGGGPPVHRHEFEEMFTVLEGTVEVTFRDETIVANAGETINVPANAPHGFANVGGDASRLLCLCAPAGQDEFFALVGQPVARRTEAAAPLHGEAQQRFLARAKELAPRYRTELLPPPGDPAP